MKKQVLPLITAVKKEVEKPFEEKLKETKRIIHIWANIKGACVSCSFGKDSMSVLHLVLQENPKIPVVFENTLIEFPETIKFAKEIVNKWDLNFFEVKPQKGVNFWTINDRIMAEGLRLDDGRKHSNTCCYHLKERPFTVWRRTTGIHRSFTGVTACESRNRMFTACMKGMEYYTRKDDLWKVHPILYWTADEVLQFLHDQNVPLNPAYAKYKLNRLGCTFCMSYQGWREEICRINNKVYCYMMRRYFGTPSLMEKAFQEEKEMEKEDVVVVEEN